MTDTCKQTDIDKNVIWRQICAFLAIQLLLMARSPELQCCALTQSVMDEQGLIHLWL